MAHLKFSVIAPVIQGLFSEPTKTAYYKENGMDGLMPRSRSDAGTSRALSDAAITEIFRLKDQFPKINATLIYNKLIQDGFIKGAEVSVSTIQRFIKKNDIKAGRPINVKDRKAFEEEFPGDMYQADICHSIYITEEGKRRKTYFFSHCFPLIK